MSAISEHDTARPSAHPFPKRPPESTYRLQFHAGFTFRHATDILPYLRDIGITHVYASPYLKARPGSTHGYDIVDHSLVNPEVGSAEDHEAFCATVRTNGLGLILDIVPNHMGVATNENPWWDSVLENGPASKFADHFDIAWKAARPELEDKVLLPVLGEPYGNVLEAGQLTLEFVPSPSPLEGEGRTERSDGRGEGSGGNETTPHPGATSGRPDPLPQGERVTRPTSGSFAVRYYERRFPVAPRSYALVLGHDLGKLEAALGDESDELAEYQSILTSIRNLPDRSETEPGRKTERQREKEIVKRRLAELAGRSEVVRGHIAAAVAAFNGTPGDPHSFDRLDDLLAHQAYRLSFWRVALEEINYRRFFDVNDLAALSVEREEVFAAAHATIFRLMAEGKVDGLRIDHPDGLYDPREYLERLRGHGADYVVVEKILGTGEPLPPDWPVAGTTGYEFLNAVNGLFVDGAAEKAFTSFYREFTDDTTQFAELVYRSKRRTLVGSLAGELNMLARQLDVLAQRRRHSRDFTLNGLRVALIELIACFPVYRSYISAAGVGDSDRTHMERALRTASRRNPLVNVAVLRFIRDMVLLKFPEAATEAEKGEQVRFAGKFQQVTSPVMAKGLEDTSFYIFNRLVSLNEVGGDPARFGTPPAALHKAFADRQRNWPRALSALSTHDTKRSEDVRARLNALTEMPEEWFAAVRRWAGMNAGHKVEVGDALAPDANEEYLLYQSILGVWEGEPGASAPGISLTPGADAPGSPGFVDRIAAFAVKALHEAKVHSSWVNPDAAYDDAVQAFVRSILDPAKAGAFLANFRAFAETVARAGAVNTLAQTLLKIAAPGVPDTYQGTELPDFSLVDPDNRRPVEYAKRRALLEELKGTPRSPEAARALAGNMQDGRAKLLVTHAALVARRERPGLFAEGEYEPLAATGPDAERVFAFARRLGGAGAVVVVPRFTLSPSPLGERGARVPLPPGEWRCAFTGRQHPGGADVAVAELFRDFPVALLLNS